MENDKDVFLEKILSMYVNEREELEKLNSPENDIHSIETATTDINLSLTPGSSMDKENYIEAWNYIKKKKERRTNLAESFFKFFKWVLIVQFISIVVGSIVLIVISCLGYSTEIKSILIALISILGVETIGIMAKFIFSNQDDEIIKGIFKETHYKEIHNHKNE